MSEVAKLVKRTNQSDRPFAYEPWGVRQRQPTVEIAPPCSHTENRQTASQTTTVSTQLRVLIRNFRPVEQRFLLSVATEKVQRYAISPVGVRLK
jgi:hypothetical protein